MTIRTLDAKAVRGQSLQRGWRKRVAMALTAVVLLVGCDDDRLQVSDAPQSEAVPPRDAELADGGWPETAAWIARENAYDRPVIVNLFASWCIPCRREMPLLIEAAAEHDNIAFLGIDHLDQRDDGEQFVADMGITFPTIYDIAGDVAAALHARGMPTTVGFNRDGVLVMHKTGELTRQSLAELVAAVQQ